RMGYRRLPHEKLMNPRRFSIGPGRRSCTKVRVSMGRPSRRAPVVSPRERYAAGKRLRRRLPRQAQATWKVAHQNTSDRLSPIFQANEDRLPRLLPEKYKRMRASPFAFFRAPPPLIAAHLATTP